MSTPGQAGDPTFGQYLWDELEAHARELWTAFPGAVVSYDASSQTATIRPGIRIPVELDPDDAAQTDGLTTEADGTFSLTIPDLEQVPVRMPFVGGGWRVVSSLAPGDLVMCHITTRDLWGWLDGGGQPVRAALARHHDLNDCWAEPWGIAETTDSLVLEGHGAKIELKPDGTVILNDGTKAAARTGDSVDMGTLTFSTPATIAGTYTPPGGIPVPFTVGVPIALSGKVGAGSTSVKIGG
jgi:hypothetical protein